MTLPSCSQTRRPPALRYWPPMNETPAPAQPNWQTLQVATGNLLNLALPGRNFYPGQDGYDDAEYERKVAYNRTRPYRHGGKKL